MSNQLSRTWCALLLVCLACGSEPSADAAMQGDAQQVGAGDAGVSSTSVLDAALNGSAPSVDAAMAAGTARTDAGSSTVAGDAGVPVPTGDAGADPAGSSDALKQLTTYLASPRAGRPALAEQPFARVPLTKEDALSAGQRIWDDFAKFVREDRKGEVGATASSARTVTANGKTLKYYLARTGSDPAGGRSLFISMHGGGNAGAATNDSQWQNQVALVDGYNPKDAIWVAPRAPIDDWNMWFVDSIDPLFERLITDMIVFEGINPNKVYINGYSAGGDGVYQLGPRMGERWAGAGMSAGHPNAASPLSLRNVPFAIHVGADDTAYDRDKKAMEWGTRLEMLAAADPGGYINQWQVHAGKPHWMDMEDAVSIPFLQSHTRDPIPRKIVWEQADVTRATFYWLAVDGANRTKGNQIYASYDEAGVHVTLVKGVKRVLIRLSDAMLDLNRPVTIDYAGKPLLTASVARTIATIGRTLDERNDPGMWFPGEVTVDIP